MLAVPHRTLVVVAAVLAVFGLLFALGLAPPCHGDSARDFLLARDCRAGLGCEGPPTAASLVHGSLWTRLIALVELDTLVLLLLVVAGAIAGVAVVERLARPYGELAAGLAASFYLGLGLSAAGFPLLWSPALTPLLAPLLTLAVTRAAVEDGLGTALAGGALMALAFEIHPLALTVAPALLAAVVLTSRRPPLAVLALGGVALLLELVVSPRELAANLAVLRGRPLASAAALLGLLALLGAAARWRRRWAALPPPRRRHLALLAVALTLPLQLVIFLLAGLVPVPHHLAFAAPALSLFAAIGLARWWRRGWLLRAVAVALVATPALPSLFAELLIGGGLIRSASTPAYSLDDAARIGAVLRGHDYRYREMELHLVGADAGLLLHGLAVATGDLDGVAPRSRLDVRVVTTDAARIPAIAAAAPGWAVALRGSRVAYLAPLDSWVRRLPTRSCSAGPPPSCLPAAPRPPPRRFADLAYPSFVDLDDKGEISWELPVDVRGSDPARRVDVVAPLRGDWRIVAVEGVAHEGTLPARSVVLRSGGGTEGRLTVAAPASVFAMRALPPDLLESRLEEGALRDAALVEPPLVGLRTLAGAFGR